LYVSSIIKFYSLLVICVNILVLGYGHQIDNDPKWKNVKLWLQMIGLKANSIDFGAEEIAKMSKKEKKEKLDEIELAVLRNRMLAMCIFFLASMYLTGHFSSKIKQAKED